MSDLREAAEMALEALRNAEIVKMEQLEAMYALQEALAQTGQESWQSVQCTCGGTIYFKHTKREWVGLTDEEAREIRLRVGSASDVYARAIEAKLKEKNT